MKYINLAAGLRICLMVIGLSAAGIPAISYGAPIILSATEDAVVLDGENSNGQFPGLLASELGTSGSGSVWISILKFDLSALTGMTVNGATFELTSVFNHNAGAFLHDVYSSSDDSWAEGTVTGVSRPANSTITLLDSTSINGTSQASTWNVLAGVTGADGLAGTGKVLTLFIRPDLSQAGTVLGPHFNDRTVASGFPRLILDVSPSAAVPEPGTLALLAFGFAGIGFGRACGGRRK